MIGRVRRRAVRALPEPTLRKIARIQHRETPDLTRAAVRPAPRGVRPATVTTFDAWAARAAVTDAVAATLDAGAIPYVRLPGPRGTTRELAVAADDRVAAMAAIGSAVTGDGWRVTPDRKGTAIRVTRALAAAGGSLLTGPDNGCDVTFWPRVTRSDVPRTDGEPHLPGTLTAPRPNGVTGYLTAPTWHRAVTSPTHWIPGALPDVFDVDEPVDLVYTWVDGTDPEWLRRKAQHSPGDASSRHASATDDVRYVGRDELRYSMRSVAMYASWVRTIYLVTDGQRPPWLDLDAETNPRVVLVDHRDIFTDPSVLPVFNSHAIESQLHHIDGLSEYYLYLNDDMFFGAPVGPELFFNSAGIATFFPGRDTIDLDPPSARDLPVVSAAKNLRALLERDFGVTARDKFRHVAHPQLRSIAVEIEQRYPQMMAEVAASRFRHPDDVSIPSALAHYYAYVRGRAVPGDVRYRYQDLSRRDTARRLDEIARQRPQAFCLNDVAAPGGGAAETSRAVAQFLDGYFPLPAPWER